MDDIEIFQEWNEQELNNGVFTENSHVGAAIAFAKYYHKKQLKLYGVSNSFNLEIKDIDIATIEAMHDTLLDEKILGLNARSMKESRALTQRMYKALGKD